MRTKASLGLCLVVALCVSALVTPAGAASPPKGGGTYGGFTKSGWPLVIQVARSGKQVTRAGIVLDMTCTSGVRFPFPDNYNKLAISKSGAFKSSFADELIDEGQGHFALLSGSISGKLNRARTKITGTWTLHDTERDAQGTPTDQCDSGTVRFSANQ
jgi:hypothetical protein